MTDTYCPIPDYTLPGHEFNIALNAYNKCLHDQIVIAAGSPTNHQDIIPPPEPIIFDFAKWWTNYGSWILIMVLVLIVVVVGIVVNNKTKRKVEPEHV